MKDERGNYYYPNPAQKRTRMYVRKNFGVIEFRLYSPDNPEIWERHGWLAMDVVRAAAALAVKEGKGDAALALYDERVAVALLRDEDPLL
ncbi:MAG: hypothetical protein AB7E47_13370 [Desulfovibrionaceae bacterium]